MAGKAIELVAGGGIEGFFGALDALSYREHLEVAQLLAMQLEDKSGRDAAAIAEALADASDSFADTGEEG